MTSSLYHIFVSIVHFITNLIRPERAISALAPILALPAPAQPVALLPAWTATHEFAAVAEISVIALHATIDETRSPRLAAETANQRMARRMMDMVPGAATPGQAHSALMQQWLAQQAPETAIAVKAAVRVSAAEAPKKEHKIAVNVKREKVIQCIVKGIELDLQRGEYRNIIPEDGAPLYIKPGSTIVKVRANGEDLEVYNGYEWVRVDEDCIARFAEIENVPLPPKSEAGIAPYRSAHADRLILSGADFDDIDDALTAEDEINDARGGR